MQDNYQFYEEKFMDIIDELDPLFEKHYKEIAHYQDIPKDMDIDQYDFIEKHGFLKVYTCRHVSGALVGYAIFFVKTNIHYKGSLQANQDILFIDPKHRGFGKSFIKYCDDELTKLGVQVVYHHVKLSHNWGALLERMGYEAIETIYGRRL